jgi:hypothetical protein
MEQKMKKNQTMLFPKSPGRLRRLPAAQKEEKKQAE